MKNRILGLLIGGSLLMTPVMQAAFLDTVKQKTQESLEVAVQKFESLSNDAKQALKKYVEAFKGSLEDLKEKILSEKTQTPEEQIQFRENLKNVLSIVGNVLRLAAIIYTEQEVKELAKKAEELKELKKEQEAEKEILAFFQKLVASPDFDRRNLNEIAVRVLKERGFSPKQIEKIRDRVLEQINEELEGELEEELELEEEE